MKFDLVCFDYDGVLVDSFFRQQQIVDEARTILKIGRAPVPSDFQEEAVLSFESVGRRLGIPEDRLSQFKTEVGRIQSSKHDLPCCFEGMPELVKEVSLRSKVALITASFRAEVDAVLAREHLDKCVSFLFDGNDNRSKSDKILELLTLTEISAKNVLMIGDARSDIQAGKKAGVQTLAVGWGYQKLEFLKLEQPDYCVHTVHELVEALAQNNQLNQIFTPLE